MKILVAIANHGTKNAAYLNTLIAEYRSMPYQIDIVVLSNIPKDLGADIEVLVGLPAKNPWSLPFGHKKLFAERASDYDLFIYSEDDTLVSHRNIKGFLEVQRILPEQEIAGFLRYERDPSGNKFYSTVHSRFHWVPGSVKRIEGRVFARFTNDHSACYILTRKQLGKAIESGGYLVEPHDERYDLLVTAATDPYTQCGFTKVICISHLEDFEIHHLPDVYVGNLGLAEAEFRRQVRVLLQQADGSGIEGPLFPIETKLDQAYLSKSYYEKCRQDIVDRVPGRARSVLSVGCGWGATEAALMAKGHAVTAVPLDSVIGACARAKGIEITCPDLAKAYDSLSGRRFDCMVFSDVLQHCDDPAGVLSRYAGLLSRTGIMIIGVPNFQSALVRRQAKHAGDRSLRDFARTGLQWTTERTLRTWLAQSSLKNVRAHYTFEGRIMLHAHLIPGMLQRFIAQRLVLTARKGQA